MFGRISSGVLYSVSVCLMSFNMSHGVMAGWSHTNDSVAYSVILV